MWNLSSDIWALPSEMSDVSDDFHEHCLWHRLLLLNIMHRLTISSAGYRSGYEFTKDTLTGDLFSVFFFYPRPVLAFGYCRCLRVCVCVCVSVNHAFVHAITHQPFKLGSLNLDQRCKRPWLRALLFCGKIDHDLQGQIELQSQNLLHFELVHAITHHQLKLQFPNLEQKMHLSTVQIPTNFGLDWN